MNDFAVDHFVGNLNRVATDLAVFDIGLRTIEFFQHHRNAPPTVRASQEIFGFEIHGSTSLPQTLTIGGPNGTSVEPFAAEIARFGAMRRHWRWSGLDVPIEWENQELTNILPKALH